MVNVHNGALPMQTPTDELRAAIRSALGEANVGMRRLEKERGLRPWALHGLLDPARQQSPSLDRAAEICTALGLQIHIGRSREEETPSKVDQARSTVALESVRSSDPLARKRLRDLETGAKALNQLVLDAGGQPFPGSPVVTASDEVRDLPGIRWVEVRPLAAAAGGGAVIDDEGVDGYLAFRRDWLSGHGIDPTQCVVIDVLGDSMLPTLPTGSSILVDRARRERRAGRVYVVRSADGLLVKRATPGADGGWTMTSDNPAYAPVRWEADAEVIGEVRWMARSIR